MAQESAGAIWKKTINTKKGPVEVLNITIEGKRYTAWPNSFKQAGDKSPDYRLQVDNYEPKTQQTYQPVSKSNDDGFDGNLPF